jgi:tetratricopeptide (TPR) repeat protein
MPISDSTKVVELIIEDIYGRKSQYDKAISDYSKAIEINPKSALTYNNRGNVYAAKGQYDKAISDYNKAIEINPSDAGAYNNRAIAYSDKGQYDKAWDDVHKAESLGYKVHPGFLRALRQASGRQK